MLGFLTSSEDWVVTESGAKPFQLALRERRGVLSWEPPRKPHSSLQGTAYVWNAESRGSITLI